MKKAILVVSFGTCYQQAVEEDIVPVERAMAAAFPDREVRRAFTSGVIRRKLLKRGGSKVDGVVEALEALRLEGFQDVLLQPTHLLNGIESERLNAEAKLYALAFERFTLGSPLLSRREDYFDLVDAIMEELPDLADHEALILMGRGTTHYTNASYAALEYVFHDRGYSNVFVGTAKSYPGIEEVIRRLDEQINVRQIYLAPLLLVSGCYVHESMTGSAPNTWVNQLKDHNYQPVPLLRGLGTYESIQRLFVSHAKDALHET